MKVGREEKLYGKRAGGDAGSGHGKSRLQINLGDAAALIWLRREDQRDGSREGWIRDSSHSQSQHREGNDQKRLFCCDLQYGAKLQYVTVSFCQDT